MSEFGTLIDNEDAAFEFEQLENEKDDLERRLNGMNQSFNDLQNKTLNMQANINDLNKQLTAMTDERNAAQQKITNLQFDNTNLLNVKQISDNDARIINVQIERNNQEIANLTTVIDTKNQEVKMLGDEVDKKTTDLSNLDAEIKSKDKEIGKLNDLLKTKNTKVNELNNIITKQKQDKKELKAKHKKKITQLEEKHKQENSKFYMPKLEDRATISNMLNHLAKNPQIAQNPELLNQIEQLQPKLINPADLDDIRNDAYALLNAVYEAGIPIPSYFVINPNGITTTIFGNANGNNNLEIGQLTTNVINLSETLNTRYMAKLTTDAGSDKKLGADLDNIRHEYNARRNAFERIRNAINARYPGGAELRADGLHVFITPEQYLEVVKNLAQVLNDEIKATDLSGSNNPQLTEQTLTLNANNYKDEAFNHINEAIDETKSELTQALAEFKSKLDQLKAEFDKSDTKRDISDEYNKLNDRYEEMNKTLNADPVKLNDLRIAETRAKNAIAEANVEFTNQKQITENLKTEADKSKPEPNSKHQNPTIDPNSIPPSPSIKFRDVEKVDESNKEPLKEKLERIKNQLNEFNPSSENKGEFNAYKSAITTLKNELSNENLNSDGATTALKAVQEAKRVYLAAAYPNENIIANKLFQFDKQITNLTKQTSAETGNIKKGTLQGKLQALQDERNEFGKTKDPSKETPELKKVKAELKKQLAEPTL